MAAVPFFYTALDANGFPLSGALLDSFSKGTASRQGVYTDSALSTLAANPAVADATGNFRLYLDETLNYSLSATDSTGASIRLQIDYTAGAPEPFTITYATQRGLEGLSDEVLEISDDIAIVAANDLDISTVADNMGAVNTVADAVADGSLDLDAKIDKTGGIITYDTFAAARAASGLADGRIVYIKGEAAADDGLFGIWRAKSFAESPPSDDGVDVLVMADATRLLKQDVATGADLSNLLVDTPLTGTTTVEAPTASDDSTRVISSAWIRSLLTTTYYTQTQVTDAISAAIANVIGGAPGALDTLNELAASLNDDDDFAASVTASLALKAPLESPVFTGAPTAPSPAESDNTTRIATTAYTRNLISNSLLPYAPKEDAALTGETTAESINISGFLRTAEWAEVDAFLPDGLPNDWGAAVTAMVAAGYKYGRFPSKTITLDDKISFPVDTFWDCTGCQFHINTTDFNMSATAVLEWLGTNSGAWLFNPTVVFDQPDTAVRASLNTYPPALKIDGCANSRVFNPYIVRAMVGISMVGNCGGSVVHHPRLSCLEVDIDIDGPLHTVYINELDIWVAGMTTNQRSIRTDGNAVGVKIGRCDDIQINGGVIFDHPVAIRAYTSGSGTCFGSVSHVNFDQRGGILVEAGDLQFIAPRGTLGLSGSKAFVQTGGEVYMNQASWKYSYAGGTGIHPIIDVQGGVFSCNDMLIDSRSGKDHNLIKAATGSEVYINGVRLRPTASIAYTNKFIELGAAAGSVQNVRVVDAKGAGSATVLATTADPKVMQIRSVYCNGWTAGQADGFRTASWDTAVGDGAALSVHERAWRLDGQVASIEARLQVSTAPATLTYLPVQLPILPARTVSIACAISGGGKTLAPGSLLITAGNLTAQVFDYDGGKPIANRRIHIAGSYTAS